jgi:hypothetical protein
MMKRRTYAEFTANFPDDFVLNEAGDDFEIFGGRLASEAIADALRNAGYRVDPPNHAHEHGWEFSAWEGKRRLWLQVTRMEDADYILITEAMLGLFQRMSKVDLSYYADFLTKLNEGLRRDDRFGSVGWFRQIRFTPVGEPTADPLQTI